MTEIGFEADRDSPSDSVATLTHPATTYHNSTSQHCTYQASEPRVTYTPTSNIRHLTLHIYKKHDTDQLSTMVYYTSPKRAAFAKAPSKFQTFPDELLLNIVGDLETRDVVNLRGTHSRFVGVSNETLAKRYKVLYLHPTTTSLRQAVDICKQPLFAASITEVVMLSKVLWSDIATAMPDVRNTEQAKGISPDSVKGRYCPWPNKVIAKRFATQQSEAGHAKSDLETNYRELVNALAGLPKLTKLSYSNKVSTRGWNQTGEDVIESHAKKCAESSRAPLHERPYADIEMIGHLLGKLDSVSTLQLNMELLFGPHAANVMRGIEARGSGPAFGVTLCLSLRNLTSISLVLHVGNNDEAHNLAFTLIAGAAPLLRSLELILAPVHARAQNATMYRDLSFLSLHKPECKIFTSPERKHKSRLQKLENLTLEYRDPPKPAKCKDERRRVRPSCQRLEIDLLLRCVRRTIKSVAIRNIVFPPSEFGDPRHPRNTHSKVRRSTTDSELHGGFPHLEHFEWTVNRYKHDPTCRSTSENDVHADCEKRSCGQYLPAHMLQEYERTAQALGVPLIKTAEGEGGEAFGYWDFGAAIMEDRRQLRQLGML